MIRDFRGFDVLNWNQFHWIFDLTFHLNFGFFLFFSCITLIYWSFGYIVILDWNFLKFPFSRLGDISVLLDFFNLYIIHLRLFDFDFFILCLKLLRLYFSEIHASLKNFVKVEYLSWFRIICKRYLSLACVGTGLYLFFMFISWYSPKVDTFKERFIVFFAFKLGLVVIVINVVTKDRVE